MQDTLKTSQSPVERVVFSNRQAAAEWSATLTTRTGQEVFVTPASPDDRNALELFFDKVSQQDRYFRFLSGIRKIDAARLDAMVRDDDDRTIDFLVRDPASGDILATAMLAANPDTKTAEFALCTREDMKFRGISWVLLDHAARYAESRGIKKLISIEHFTQADALELEREMGFTVHHSADDPTLMLAEKTFP